MASITIEPLSAALGARVHRIDLGRLGEAGFETIRKALLENQVLFFPGAHLDDESHFALAERFGTVSLFPMRKALGATEPTMGVIRDGPDSPPEADNWHTDVTWSAEPPRFALLRSTLVPERGGDTMWASMTAAYRALSAPVRTFLDGLMVEHDCDSFLEGAVRKIGAEAAAGLKLEEKLRAAYATVRHPLIRTHPETGENAIYFGGHFMKRIVDLEPIESEAVLRMVAAHIEQPRFQCRWSWTEGDLVIWDEAATVHRAISDHYPREREVRRVTVDGDRPFHGARAA